MAKIPAPLLIFDLDGTLADTAPDLIATLNRIIATQGISPVDRSLIGQLIGQGAKAMIAKAFNLAERPLDEDLHDRLFDDFIRDYSENIAVETRLYEGLLDVMDVLEGEGFEFCVCTNKTESLARILLEESCSTVPESTGAAASVPTLSKELTGLTHAR